MTLIPNPYAGPARAIRESGGTVLSLGSVPDGQFLKRVGTDIVGAAASGSATFGPVDQQLAPDPATFGGADDWLIEFPFSTGNVTGATGPSRNLLRCRPIPFGSLRVLTDLAFVVNIGQAGALGRHGIYELSSAGYPTTLVLDGGEMDLSTSGRKSTTGLSQSIDPAKRYGYAFLGGGSGTDPTYVARAASAQPFTVSVAAAATSIAVATSGGWLWSVAQTYGALPSTFPAGASSTSISRGCIPIALWRGTGVAP